MIRRAGRFALALGLGAVALGAASLAIGLLAGRGEGRVLPVDPARFFDPDFRRTAAGYAGIKYSYWAAGSLLRWGALAGVVSLGGGAALARAAGRPVRGRKVPTAFLAGVLVLAALAVATLPLAYASGHVVEREYGLTGQGAAGWLADWGKREAFWIPVYAALMAGFLFCVDRWPRWGWAVAGAGAVAVAVLGVFAAPRVIDPLFHDFRPLEDAALERDIVALGQQAGIRVDRVRVMDASRTTNRLNAYVTGLGATRQVVLFDNLLEKATPDEVRLVVAHEMGHAAAHHVRRGLLSAVPAILLGTLALAALARRRAAADPDLGGPGDPAGIPLLWLAVSLGLFLTSPVQSAISRRMEAEADWASLELTRDPDTFVAVEERLTRANLSPVTPPEWLVEWLWTHPPVLERIGMAEYWRAEHGSMY